MTSKTQFLTKWYVEIVLSYISNEMNRLSESHGNILKCIPSDSEKNVHLEYCWHQGRPCCCYKVAGGQQPY